MSLPPYLKSITESVWRNKYSTLREYYKATYNPKYFQFDKYQLEIDPDEPMEIIDSYDPARRQLEIIKCVHSFSYFCHKFVKILHPTRGLVPFIMFKYQHKVISDYENHRFNIISKFRQGGLTTVTLLWGMFKCMFRTDQQIMLLSKTDREATDIGMMIDRAVENIPEWLRPKKDGKWNDHLKMFTETGSSLKFYSPQAARGKSVTFLIIDEAAFIEDMDKHWKAMWPVLSTGGSCALVSTVNGIGNWYYQTYIEAKEKRNLFNVIDLDYWEHPDYNNPNWASEQKAQLGEKGFLQEVLREFLGSGETYFSSKIVRELTEQTMNNYPSKKLFSKWVNLQGFASTVEREDNKGALWVWKEPVEGRDYIVGADCAEGQAENNDNSCFQVIDQITCEQVAEFYSNTVSPNVFAQILKEVCIYYNNALLVVENMGPGIAVLNTLQNHLFYDNIYFENKKGNPKPGVRMGQVNRPLFLETLQSRLINKSIRINSIRFTNELGTFEYNPSTKKAQAQKGKHDDAIMSMCIALFIRDQIQQDIPMGANIETKQGIGKLSNEVYEEIKRELMDGNPEEILEMSNDMMFDDDDYIANTEALKFRRKHNNLMKEFGW
jgi:hypothetical protein